jgi:hypothetical protein
VESLVLPLVDGLLGELLNGELLSADRLLSDGPVGPLSTSPAPLSILVPGARPAPESAVLPVAPLVSLGCSPMMASSVGNPSDESFTEVIEARQRM